MPTISDTRYITVVYDAGTLSFVPWDGSLTTGALTIGTVNQGTAGGAAWPVSLYRISRSDTFTGATSGTTVDASASAAKAFAIAVKGTGGVASAWDIRLEGSLDNVNFTQILQHTNTAGDGVTLFTGASLFPCLYFRSRCASVTLGPATNLVTTITGMQ